MQRGRGLLRVVATGLAVLAIAASHAAPREVDVNRANRAQLEQLRGIGPPLAERILLARAQGPFRDWGDLMGRVPGIRAATARRLSAAGLTVEGRSYDDAASPR